MLSLETINYKLPTYTKAIGCLLGLLLTAKYKSSVACVVTVKGDSAALGT